MSAVDRKRARAHQCKEELEVIPPDGDRALSVLDPSVWREARTGRVSSSAGVCRPTALLAERAASLIAQ